MHLAVESHLAPSIYGPAAFIVGTDNLLESARAYWNKLDANCKSAFRFHHTSTDDVYVDIEGKDDLFTEITSYAPFFPYSASKASSDHLIRAWQRNYGLPIIVANCLKNYGPFHFLEKLIPLKANFCNPKTSVVTTK